MNPPPAARPGVLWDWMGGMISRDGITKDLEAMAAQGIGKVMIMQMPDQCPYPRQWSYRDYPGKVKVLSDEWYDLMNFAVGECDRLGIEIASFACPGWGHVGGPWVPKDKGTKKMAMTSVFAHREIDGRTLYYVINDSEESQKTSITLNTGKKLEEWDPSSGEIIPVDNPAEIELPPYHATIYRSLK